MDKEMINKLIGGIALVVCTFFVSGALGAPKDNAEKQSKMYELVRDIDKNVALTGRDVVYIKETIHKQDTRINNLENDIKDYKKKCKAGK